MAITVKHLKVSTIPDSGDDTLIEPSDWNNDHVLTGTIPVANGGTGAATLTGYVKGNGTSAMTAATTIPNTDITGLGTASTKDAGSANGVATLDSGGKVPVSELPAAVLGALSYQGTWNASTNSPTLTSSVGTKGYYYVVSVAGSTDLNGITDWQVGDWAVFNGSVWQKVDNTDAGGDVVGPASATDNAITRFDGTTGKLIQNSVVTMDDTGVIAGATLTSPKINEILDTNGNEILGLSPTASATDFLTVKNGIGVGVPLHVYADGSSTSIGLHIQPKGTGLVTISDGTDFNKGIRFRSSSSAASAITLLDAVASSGRVVTLPDATTTLVGRDTTDTLTNKSISGSTNTLSNIGNAALTNSAITINGTSTSLGGSINVGSVTSVGLTAPTMFTVSGSPVTGTGTLALTYSGTALPVANGGTARTVGNYSVFANEIHVSKDGNDTTGDGTLINPVLTITKALTLIAGLKKTVIVHAGDYPESPTVSTANTTIATSELTGANTTITGTLTLSAAARVSGIKISNLTITGSGSTYISNCTVDTQVVKSGTNYVEIINTELQCVSGVQITGAGTVSIVGNKNWGVTVSNASANVLIKDCFQVLTPSVTAGTLNIDGCAIFASSPASNAVTSSAGTFITLANSFVLNSAGTSVERVSLAGSYSILNLVYDKTNSTFTGTNLNAIDYFSVVNADTLVLTNKLAIAYGGTNSSATPTAGAVPYGTGTAYGFSAAGTAGQVLTSQGAGTPTWTTPATGTVTSVTGTAPVVSSGGATPAISMAAATGSVNGYLTSTDWTTFNGKAPAVTYTTNYVPFGQGTTTPNLSSSFTYVTGTGTLTAPAVSASNGLVINSNTVSASYSIPSGSSASSVGPMTVASGQTVTVPSGSRWVVL